MSDRRTIDERRLTLRPNSNDRRLIADRRRKKRYIVKDGAFAALINQNQRLGQIRDISLVGLSFRYIDAEEQFHPDSVLKIILAGCGLYLDNLPYEPVNDYEIDYGNTFSFIKVRQMHLAFGELTQQQIRRLDQFIINHTMGEA